MQNHQPLWFDFPEYVRRYPKARIVSMFRDPRRRIVSAWNHDGGKHAYGIEPKDRPRIDGHQTIAEYVPTRQRDTREPVNVIGSEINFGNC